MGPHRWLTAVTQRMTPEQRRLTMALSAVPFLLIVGAELGLVSAGALLGASLLVVIVLPLIVFRAARTARRGPGLGWQSYQNDATSERWIVNLVGGPQGGRTVAVEGRPSLGAVVDDGGSGRSGGRYIARDVSEVGSATAMWIPD